MENYNYEIVRGDTSTLTIGFTNLEGTISAMAFSCKKHATDETYIFQKTLGSGITANQDGTYIIRIAPADTSSQELGGYYYDVQITVGSDIFTILKGRLTLGYEITRE